METAEVAMWERIGDDPFFRDIPFKVETNESDQIILSAYVLSHSRYQGRITRLLNELLTTPGELPVELAIATGKGVKVPDVAWISDERLNSFPDDTKVCEQAPELCVEVLSPSNTEEEIQRKRELYFENGALEVWVCDADGGMTFYGPEGEIEASKLVTGFPSQINL